MHSEILGRGDIDLPAKNGQEVAGCDESIDLNANARPK
jgi:hypothetical protein